MKNPNLLLKTPILFLITLVLAAMASVQSVHAATITVMNTNDSGAGSLRDALATAAAGDTINFNLTYPATITLTSGELAVVTSVTISGPGADHLTVTRSTFAPEFRIFHVSYSDPVEISGLTITNGNVPFGDDCFTTNFSIGCGSGGGILNDHAILTVESCTVSANSGWRLGNIGSSGGGIFNDAYNGSATLTVRNSTISGNFAPAHGGGIFNNGQQDVYDPNPANAILTVENSIISGNQSQEAGGGIYNYEWNVVNGGATVTVTDSTISGNGAYAFDMSHPAPQGSGAGICNISSNEPGANGSATLTVTNSTISGNQNSGFSGGGIYNGGGTGNATATVTNSTISGNNTDYDSAVGSGGGICNIDATLIIENSTVSDNRATDGAGIDNYGNVTSDSAMLTVTNSTISGNHAWMPSGNSGGGGIRNIAQNFGSAMLTLTNSTLSGNEAGGRPHPDYGAQVSGFGGGIQNKGFDNGSATATVTNSTISGNDCGFDPLYIIGGDSHAIHNYGTSGSAMVTITNSTLTGNFSPMYNSPESHTILNDSATLTVGDTILNGFLGGGFFTNIKNVSGSVTTSLGYNLNNDGGSGYLTTTGDQINTDPMLGPLQDNGGPTFTHALLTGSQAIDAGKNFSGSTTDQRGSGFARTFDDPTIANAAGGDGTDIGAFEVQAAYAAQIRQPINADGTSVFNFRRGVVPVKFTLTFGGVATCNLPSATIAVYRTGTGGNQQIDESDYSGAADTGSNFRIDSCQYIYNLSASALGVGTYQVDIMINGQVVGSVTFALR